MMSSPGTAGPPGRALLAAGTSVYSSPDFNDLDMVQPSLTRIVHALSELGYTAVTDSPGYLLNPGVRDLRASAQKAMRAAPIVVVYYTGHGVIERGSPLLITKNSRSADHPGTSLRLSDLLSSLSRTRQEAETQTERPAVLVILDHCYSGPSGIRTLERAEAEDGSPNIWILTTTDTIETSAQGLFADAFANALQEPPSDPSQAFQSLDAVVDAINKAQPQLRVSLISPLGGVQGIPPFFPNPLSYREKDGRTEERATAIRLIVPAITDDATEGQPDRLGVDADAQALAALVASRALEPPLAIGLYGEWGSGKTFFMKRIQASVEDLAISSDNDTFCTGVTAVWFSAWQYAEGNLWASLLHHVFATLSPGKSQPQLAFDDVMAKVQGAQQVTSAVVEQVDAATARLSHASKAISAAEQRHQEALQKASRLQTKDLWDAVKLSAADQQLKDQVVTAADDLGLSVATDSAQDMVHASKQIISLASRARVLAISKPWYRSPLAYAFYAAVIVGSLGLLIGALVHVAHSWTGTAIAAIGQLAAIGSAAAAWIMRQGGLARRFIAPAETLQQHLESRLAEQQAENQRELARLQQEMDTAKAELAVALQQRATAEQQLAAAQKEQAELTGKRLLRRYLTERASSDDYEQYMGVVALAHRDLVDLEEYLRAAMLDLDDEDGLERIILYIDDLDRCDPHVVADVLDAVHLLLALRLFVVIVGVDPRWLKRSLRERHPELLEPTRSDLSSASPSDYLEKIFQLTYSLPPMSPDGCGDLLVAAAQNTQTRFTIRQPGQADDPEQGIDPVAQDADSATSSPGIGDDSNVIPLRRVEQQVSISVEDLAQALTLHEKDIQALREVAPLVSMSPRRAKRFLNVYLVVRARALGDPITRERLASDRDPSEPVSDNSLLLLVALLLGLPKTMAAAFRQGQLADTSDALTLGPWLTETVPIAPEEQARLHAFLNAGSSSTRLPMSTVLRWLPMARSYLPLSLEDLEDQELVRESSELDLGLPRAD